MFQALLATPTYRRLPPHNNTLPRTVNVLKIFGCAACCRQFMVDQLSESQFNQASHVGSRRPHPPSASQNHLCLILPPCIMQLKEAFARLDTDGDGILTSNDVQVPKLNQTTFCDLLSHTHAALPHKLQPLLQHRRDRVFSFRVNFPHLPHPFVLSHFS